MTVIEIGIAKMAVAKNPDVLVAKSLGSCVAITLYGQVSRVGAMAHVMLPDSTFAKREKNNPGKFADTAVPAMLSEMIKAGAVRSRVAAKIVGGAKMFSSVGNHSPMNVGSRIVAAVRVALRENNIEIVAQDVGKDYGRTAEFDTKDGSVRITSFGKGTKCI